jgi:hypothetical protein
MPDLRWVLTDAAKDIYVPDFRLTHEDLKLGTDQPWSIRKRTLRGGLRDGVDLIEIDNGTLSFAVIPTRGMGLWRGRYGATDLGWRSPVAGPVHPMFVNPSDRGGIGWVAGFDEWIVRCGLDSNGAPGTDVVPDNNGNPSTVQVNLHGRIANLPASFVQVRISLTEPHAISVIGHVEEAMLFGPQFRLKTEITTVPGSNRLTIRDEVVNLKAVPAEFEMLYHCNYGPPILDGGARVVAPVAEVAPRDARAAEGAVGWAEYPAPTAGFVEQCYWADLLAGETGETLAMLRNGAGDRASVLRWAKRQLPCFTLWKNPGAIEDGYVTGLEPGTNFPNTKKFERAAGRVPKLPPGGSYTIQLAVDAIEGRPAVAAVEAEIAALQSRSAPVVNARPVAKWSPM